MDCTPREPRDSIVHRSMRVMATMTLAACTESAPATPATLSNATGIDFKGATTTAIDVSVGNPHTDPRITQALHKLKAMRGGSLQQRRPPSWSVPPVYVVAPSLPAGVVYKVVRDPSSTTPRVIVFSETTMTDDRLYRSVGRLALDEQRDPSPASVRTITMYADNHYVVEYAGKVERSTVHDGMTNVAAPVREQGAESRRILREAAKGELVIVASGMRGRAFRPVP